MLKQEFINSVLAEPSVISLLPGTEVIHETYGDYEKGSFRVLIVEPQGGQNFRDVWFIRNTKTDETGYQTLNTIDTKKNTYDARHDKLEKYLGANFHAYFIIRANLEEFWAEADVFKLNADGLGVTKQTVLVFKKGANPIKHLPLT